MNTGKSFKEMLRSVNEHFLILFFIATIFILSLQVFFRTFLSTAFPWVEEVSRYLFIYFVFGGAAIAFRKGIFISVDVIGKFLPKKMWFPLTLLMSFIELFFFLIIAYIGIELFLGSSGQLTPALEVEIKYVYFAIPLFSLQMSFYAARKIISLFKEVNKGGE